MEKLVTVYKSQTASFDVDCQRGFTPLCPNELPVPDGHLIVDELNRQAVLAKYRVGSKDWHPSNALWIASNEHPQLSPIEPKQPNMDVYWNSHCIGGTKGAKLLPGLPNPEQYDFMVYKGLEPNMHPYGSCYHDLANTISTGVIEFLHRKTVKTVIVGGLATDYCVKTTVKQLLYNGFMVILNLGGCRGITEKTTNEAIEEMKNYSVRKDYMCSLKSSLNIVSSYTEMCNFNY